MALLKSLISGQRSTMRQKNGEQIEDKGEACYAMLRDLGNMGGRNS
jgi:hypothetical protein